MSGIDKQRADDPQQSALAEAMVLVYGDREQAYGHPLDDFARTAGMISAMLTHPEHGVTMHIPVYLEERANLERDEAWCRMPATAAA